MGVTLRTNRLRLQDRLSAQASTPIRANASFCRHRLNQPWNRRFRAKTQKPVLTESPQRALFQVTGTRYLTSWNVASRKSSDTSEIDNQADAILDSGGSTTNEPNCAAQLTGRSYVHPCTSSIHARRCI